MKGVTFIEIWQQKFTTPAQLFGSTFTGSGRQLPRWLPREVPQKSGSKRRTALLCETICDCLLDFCFKFYIIRLSRSDWVPRGAFSIAVGRQCYINFRQSD